ncbi:class III extradiol dioxygenase subunit B-like domain-containing protein [Actinomadura sp. 9N407]|uniref:class III extradiol dioxygenase subunit B-like domain-containing protein n=1 Tax=Actinomadura sp. 9N407 TaxID=3375154 RepID=UPI0037A786C0
MLIFAAVCPHPPLLVPEMAGEAAHELDGLRAACEVAVRRLKAAVGTDGVLYVVGGDIATRAHGPEAVGSLRPYGLGDEPVDGPVLPLSLTIGSWLLKGEDARFQSVAYDTPAEDCLKLGRELAESAERVALLVMGDGSACLSEKAPGYLDPRAEPYDALVTEALGRGDAHALRDLDPMVSQELQAAGRAAWQVLAGAAQDAAQDPAQGYEAELLAYEAPYGVGYFVATWNGLTAQ